MKKLVQLFQLFTQLGIACSVDLANGIFIVVWLSERFGVELSILAVFVAIAMSVSPDADFLIGRHDESHKPIPFVGTLLFLAALTWPTFGFWFLLWALCALAHFVHDSIGDDNAGGVAWLWPFNKKFWTFLLSNHLLTKFLSDRAEVLLVCVHTREELTAAIGTPAWLKFYYARITPAMLWSLGYSSTVIILATWLLR